MFLFHPQLLFLLYTSVLQRESLSVVPPPAVNCYCLFLSVCWALSGGRCSLIFWCCLIFWQALCDWPQRWDFLNDSFWKQKQKVCLCQALPCIFGHFCAGQHFLFYIGGKLLMVFEGFFPWCQICGIFANTSCLVFQYQLGILVILFWHYLSIRLHRFKGSVPQDCPHYLGKCWVSKLPILPSKLAVSLGVLTTPSSGSIIH